MKKIKVERSSETGVDEILALDVSVTSPNKDQSDNLGECDELRDSSPQKMDEELSLKESSPVAYENLPTNNLIDQQQQQPQQLQNQTNNTTPQQQYPNIVNRSLPSGTPANYCHICHKELCNKYFMKTHMQKMHGINLDDLPREAASSGGVVCDICQKELCSKYFLKVHKSNTHGITDYTNGSASSQVANAATTVAAIALTNYSLNNAQKRAAINLAINQHQLQSRQAAALMNAANSSPAFNPLHMAQAAKAAMHQRDQIYASSIIGQLQRQQQQQSKQPTTQKSQQIDLQQQQNPQPQLHSPSSGSLATGANLHNAFPAAFLAATVSSPLVAAQLAQQNPFSPLNSQQAGQQQPHYQYPFLNLNGSPLDPEEDSSDRDSLADQLNDQQKAAHQSSLNSFQQHLQNQQALLNAAAVFNPAAAAAAVMAMQQQQQQNQLRQQQQQREHQLSMNERQHSAMDLRNQSITQMIAHQMINQQHEQQQQQLHPPQQLVINCNNTVINNSSGNNNSRAQFDSSRNCQEEDNHKTQPREQRQQLNINEENEDEEEDFDSDRDSLVDEGVFRQSSSAVPLSTTANTVAQLSSPADRNLNNICNNDGSLISSSNVTNENDMSIGGLINYTTDSKHNSMLPMQNSSHTYKAQPFRSSPAPVPPTTNALTTKQQLSRNSNATRPTNVLPSQFVNLLNANNSSPISLSSTETQNIQKTSTSSTSQTTTNSNNNTSAGINNNSSRYLRHYTEACPICDRRFKSIKWLQSHVMNDHKNEIENLFNLLVQVLLCSNNGNVSVEGDNLPVSSTNVAISSTSSAGAIAGLPGSLADLVGLDLQRQPQQLQQPLVQTAQQPQNQVTSATSAASRGDD